MNDEDQLPKWVKEGQDHFPSINQKIKAVKEEGQAETKRGIEKIQKADELQREVDYLAHVYFQAHDPQHWGDEIVTQSGIMMTNRIKLFDEDLSTIQDYATSAKVVNEDNHRHFLSAVLTSGSSAGTAVYLGASVENRFRAIEPTYKLAPEALEPKRLTSRETLFSDLKSILKPFGEKYVAMLEGSEAASANDNPDSQSQAAHSMRDCFQMLIEQLAPNKVVESQPWFVPVEGPPAGISRRSRLRYMLYGSGENIDDGLIQRFDELADIAKISLDICIARAHEHDPSLTKEEVRLGIDQARNSLVQILELYNNLRSQ